MNEIHNWYNSMLKKELELLKLKYELNYLCASF